MCVRSIPQLRAIFSEYDKICKYSIEETIARETSGKFEKGLKIIVRNVQDPSAFWARQLYKSMKGIGTDDHKLIRVIVSRCEVDMEQIKEVPRPPTHTHSAHVRVHALRPWLP